MYSPLCIVFLFSSIFGLSLCGPMAVLREKDIEIHNHVLAAHEAYMALFDLIKNTCECHAEEWTNDTSDEERRMPVLLDPRFDILFNSPTMIFEDYGSFDVLRRTDVRANFDRDMSSYVEGFWDEDSSFDGWVGLEPLSKKIKVFGCSDLVVMTQDLSGKWETTTYHDITLGEAPTYTINWDIVLDTGHHDPLRSYLGGNFTLHGAECNYRDFERAWWSTGPCNLFTPNAEFHHSLGLMMNFASGAVNLKRFYIKLERCPVQ